MRRPPAEKPAAGTMPSVSKSAFTLRYLARAVSGVPRDLTNTLVLSKLKPIRPTVLIYNCTWVCDARCEMCNNWKHGDRKADMTLAQLEPAMSHPFWGAIENLNISGGEPTTRNDLPEMVEMFQRRLPRMRKIGINTTGLTPHRAVPMLTRIVEFCAAHDLLISVRVSLDGIGNIHDQVRHVTRGFDKACQTIEAMQALSQKHSNFQFGIAATIFGTNFDDAQNILTWARTKKLDIVFNMLRFTDAMLNNKELEEKIGFHEREEDFMRKFFLERVQEESVLSGQAFLYLHYADMIANGYKRTMPCPFRTQGLLLNPYGDLHYCENSEPIGNLLTTPAEEIYFKAENLAHREHVEKTVCPTCLSPCQVNVGAMKQFVPYAKFLVRAYQVKQAPSRHLATLPTPQP
jgi:sulfatase maturation enzyme AslB (radical SAM superfamily)